MRVKKISSHPWRRHARYLEPSLAIRLQLDREQSQTSPGRRKGSVVRVALPGHTFESGFNDKTLNHVRLD